MKKNIENFDTFIIEQKVWFEENLAADFAESWDSLVWICGKKEFTGCGSNTDAFSKLQGFTAKFRRMLFTGFFTG